MHPDSAKYLWDVVRYAAALVERFIAGKGFDECASDLLVKSAVERQLEIIGEALNALSRKDLSTAANIAELPRIGAFRNLLIHGYANADDPLVWGVVKTKLPTLQATIERLLAPNAD